MTLWDMEQYLLFLLWSGTISPHHPQRIGFLIFFLGVGIDGLLTVWGILIPLQN